ncbi:MAG: ATP phosphoribosyltransferase regulatory subunit [Candidatus Eutrophobiaceae bacterium]
MKNRWLLPEGMEEILPPQAWQLESLCRAVLDLCRSWGYELLIPPMLEYLESLLAGTGEDLSLKTFKVTDQLSGRMMGIRADMTPQVARLDAHVLKQSGAARYCYLGSVLHTRPDASGETRVPLQAGAELYGYGGIDGDAESLCLMIETLHLAGVDKLHVDIGHVGICHRLLRRLGLASEVEELLFTLLQRKASAELRAALAESGVKNGLADALVNLTRLHGNFTVIEDARKDLVAIDAGLGKYFDELATLHEILARQCPGVRLTCDLAEIRGYRYYTGIRFASYRQGMGAALALGGRYDGIGASFGSARPATGFSVDLKALLGFWISSGLFSKAHRIICAPSLSSKEHDNALRKTIAELRQGGDIVLMALSGIDESLGVGVPAECTHVLRRVADNVWQPVPR